MICFKIIMYLTMYPAFTVHIPSYSNRKPEKVQDIFERVLFKNGRGCVARLFGGSAVSVELYQAMTVHIYP